MHPFSEPEKPEFIVPFDVPHSHSFHRPYFHKKWIRLEGVVQRIKSKKSRLMAEICAPGSEEEGLRGCENENRASGVKELQKPFPPAKFPLISPQSFPYNYPTFEGVLPPGGKYVCKKCNSDERTPYQLCEHIAIYHSPIDNREWRCVWCKTTFGRRGGLRRHVQMVHMQMMHKCPVENCTHPGYKCTKALNAHMKTHSHPFSCSQCDKSFTKITDLANHAADHPTK